MSRVAWDAFICRFSHAWSKSIFSQRSVVRAPRDSYLVETKRLTVGRGKSARPFCADDVCQMSIHSLFPKRTVVTKDFLAPQSLSAVQIFLSIALWRKEGVGVGARKGRGPRAGGRLVVTRQQGSHRRRRCSGCFRRLPSPSLWLSLR